MLVDMLVINFRKLGLRVREAYFASHPFDVPSQGADVVYCVQAVSGPLDATDFDTSVLDLEQPLEVLHAALSKTYRYEIRRAAEKDQLHCVQLDQPTLNDLRTFVEFYDKFARPKRLQPAHREKLACLLKSDALRLCFVYPLNSHESIVAHAFVVAGHRVRLLYSASQIDKQNSKTEGQLVGRSNKFLHWDNIVHFRSLGCRRYDLGGMSSDSSQKSITEFKRHFGGASVREFNHVRPGSAVGRIALEIRRLLHRSRPLGDPRKSP
jgi:hypothetical protein